MDSRQIVNAKNRAKWTTQPFLIDMSAIHDPCSAKIVKEKNPKEKRNTEIANFSIELNASADSNSERSTAIATITSTISL